MLTVKHIQPQGTEDLFEAVRVEYHPRRVHTVAPSGVEDATAAFIAIETPQGGIVPLGAWGRFYVMNDNGATVASYDLGGGIEGTAGDVPPPLPTGLFGLGPISVARAA